MSDFRKLDDQVFASPQISLDDVQAAARQGVAMIINNRPDGEEEGQIPGEDIAAAATAQGIVYQAIPVSHAGFSMAQVEAMTAALEEASGPVLAYCRSGTRSTFLWAMAQAKRGRPLEEITQAAASAGYDVTPISPTLEALARG